MQQKNGELCSKVVVESNYGAYIVDDSKYPYYFVEWIGVPWEADEDGELDVGYITYHFHKGDHMCHRIWLEE